MRVVSALVLMLAGCAPEAPEPGVRTLTLLHTSDLHSHVFPELLTIGPADAARGLGALGTLGEVGGLARLATVLDTERGSSEWSAYLDSGDLMEGTPVFELTRGELELSVMDWLGLDAMAVGNHDLAVGIPALSSSHRDSPPLLGANLAGHYGSWLGSHRMLERAGARVLIVGLGRPPNAPADLRVAADVVNDAIGAAGESADLVVVLSHLGRSDDLALVPLTSGVDVVLGGHTHDILDPPRVVPDCGEAIAARTACRPHGVMVLHSGAYGRYVGRVDLVVSSRPADVRAPRRLRRTEVVDTAYRLIPVSAAVEERADVGVSLEPYRTALASAGFTELVARAPEAVTRTGVQGGDSALGNLVTRAIRMLGEGDLAVINRASLRADLPASALDRAAIFQALPFDDQLVGRTMTGAELSVAFTKMAVAACDRGGTTQVDVDGARVVFGCASGGSARVSARGEPLELAREYRVLTTDFLTSPGRWLEGLVAMGPLGGVRQAFEAYVARLPPCPPPSEPPLPCVDEAAGAVRDGRISWE